MVGCTKKECPELQTQDSLSYIFPCKLRIAWGSWMGALLLPNAWTSTTDATREQPLSVG